MLPRPTHDYPSRSNSCAACREAHAEIVRKQHLAQTESRVSTDSDLDLESGDGYDGYVDGDNSPNTFSPDLLVHKLEQVQQQNQHHVSREVTETPITPLQQSQLAEESYWDKMRRISQWRESTHQSEASSDYSPEPEPEPAPAATSRKRRLSDASFPSDTKRICLAVPSPTTPGSPSSLYPRAYSLGLPTDTASDPGAYPRAYARPKSLCSRGKGSVPLLDALHVCTACDAAFPSRQRLRRHGRSAPDACRAAVTYVLE